MFLLINFLTVFLFFLKIELLRQDLLDLKFVINITDIICGATSKFNYKGIPEVKIQVDIIWKSFKKYEECFLFHAKILNGSQDIAVFSF